MAEYALSGSLDVNDVVDESIGLIGLPDAVGFDRRGRAALSQLLPLDFPPFRTARQDREEDVQGRLTRWRIFFLSRRQRMQSILFQSGPRQQLYRRRPRPLSEEERAHLAHDSLSFSGRLA